MRRRIIASPLLGMYRRLAARLGRALPMGVYRIQGGPLAGRWLQTGSADTRGYSSVRLYLTGTYEPAVAAALQQHCLPGSVVCDIGAHLGYFTLLMADSVGPGGQCISFEPQPANYQMIERTLACNGMTQVKLEHAAVADREGIAPFGIHANSLMGRLVASDEPSGGHADMMVVEHVPVWTLDNYLARHTSGPLTLAKIDVEGAEVEVVRGALETISRFRPILLIEVHTTPEAQTGAEIGRILRPLNYELIQLEAGRVLQPGEYIGGHILARPLKSA